MKPLSQGKLLVLMKFRFEQRMDIHSIAWELDLGQTSKVNLA
jgi:hypothetical protein